MMWPYYGGTGWIWMTVMMVVFWGGLIALAVWAIRAFGPPRGGAGDDAMQTLRRRLAAGEITQEEFERTRRLLQS
jgi:putative membrane protein